MVKPWVGHGQKTALKGRNKGGVYVLMLRPFRADKYDLHPTWGQKPQAVLLSPFGTKVRILSRFG